MIARYLSILIFLLVLGCTPLGKVIVFTDPPLLAHWEMDLTADGTVSDLSGNGHIASRVISSDSTMTTVAGKVGNALEVSDGRSSLQVQGAAVLSTSPVSVELLFKVRNYLNSLVGGDLFNNVYDDPDSGSIGGYRISIDHGVVVSRMFAPGAADEVRIGNIQADRWYHIVATYDGQQMALYLDGVKVQKTAAFSLTPNSIYPPYMGYFMGALDYVTIYRGVLSDNAVQAKCYGVDICTAPKKANDASCSALSECSSNHCVGSICCATAGADYYKDADGDGYGVTSDKRNLCAADQTNKYTATQGGDCDDANPNIQGGTVYYKDADDDGYGVTSDKRNLCAADQTNKYTATQGGDCDDNTGSVNLGAGETCNGVDDDCDGTVDDGFDLQTDEQHCGTCGNPCSLGQQCQAGKCVLAISLSPDKYTFFFNPLQQDLPAITGETYEWNPATQTYAPATTLRSGKGYVLKPAALTTIDLRGRFLQEIIFDKAGFFLIGSQEQASSFLRDYDMIARDMTFDMQDGLHVVYALYFWDERNQRFVQVPEGVDNVVFEPGRGYFLETLAPFTMRLRPVPPPKQLSPLAILSIANQEYSDLLAQRILSHSMYISPKRVLVDYHDQKTTDADIKNDMAYIAFSAAVIYSGSNIETITAQHYTGSTKDKKMSVSMQDAATALRNRDLTGFIQRMVLAPMTDEDVPQQVTLE